MKSHILTLFWMLISKKMSHLGLNWQKTADSKNIFCLFLPHFFMEKHETLTYGFSTYVSADTSRFVFLFPFSTCDLIIRCWWDYYKELIQPLWDINWSLYKRFFEFSITLNFVINEFMFICIKPHLLQPLDRDYNGLFITTPRQGLQPPIYYNPPTGITIVSLLQPLDRDYNHQFITIYWQGLQPPFYYKPPTGITTTSLLQSTDRDYNHQFITIYRQGLQPPVYYNLPTGIIITSLLQNPRYYV